MLALKNDAEPEDAEAVVRILERNPTGSLRENALMVAGVVLECSTTPDPRLVALLGEIAFDRSLERDERLAALSGLCDAPGAEVTACR